MKARSVVGGLAAACLAVGSVVGLATRAASAAVAPATWRVVTYEHVDLWLHGFAMLTSDTGHVPFFALNYKKEIKALKQQKNIFSQLDAGQQELSQRFATNPALANAQFVAMYFPSFQEIVNATDKFTISTNPRSAADPRLAQEIA